MIDYEWRSPNPWTTVQAQGDGTTPRLNVPDDANCYDRLSHELTAYIHHQTAEGLIPTDQMIQAEARRVIYGCDDPWNQTCADNPVWLGILKRDTGLQSAMNNDRIQYSDLGLQPPFAVDGGLRNPPPETNILARAVCPGALPSPAVSSPGLRSPAYPGTGFSSAGPSGTGSLSGSYVGSAGMISADVPAFSSDWGSSVPGNASASSAPAEGSADPLVQMGFDPDFLQRLNDSYSELTPPELEDLPLGDSSTYEGKGKGKWVDPDQRISDPIAILHSKEGGSPASENAQQGRPAFYDNAGF